MKHVNLPKRRSAKDLDKNAYTICTNKKISNISIQMNPLFCKKSNCIIHCKDIDIISNNIVAALKTSGTECIPMSHAELLIRIHLFVQWQAGTSMLTLSNLG